MTEVTLAGGPLDGGRRSVEGPGLMEIMIDGVIHRYIPTTKERGEGESRLPLYQYDGAVDPDGGMAGTEDPRQRVASPLAEELREDSGSQH